MGVRIRGIDGCPFLRDELGTERNHEMAMKTSEARFSGTLEASAIEWARLLESEEAEKDLESFSSSFEVLARRTSHPKRSYLSAVKHLLRPLVLAFERRRGFEDLERVLDDVLFHPDHVEPIARSCVSWFKQGIKDRTGNLKINAGGGQESNALPVSFHRQLFVEVHSLMEEDVKRASWLVDWILRHYVTRHSQGATSRAAGNDISSLTREDKMEEAASREVCYPFIVWAELVSPLRRKISDLARERMDADTSTSMCEACDSMSKLLDSAHALQVYRPVHDAKGEQRSFLQSISDATYCAVVAGRSHGGASFALNSLLVALLKLEPRTVSEHVGMMWQTLWHSNLPGVGQGSPILSSQRAMEILQVFGDIRQLDRCVMELMKSLPEVSSSQTLCQAVRETINNEEVLDYLRKLLASLPPSLSTSIIEECTLFTPVIFSTLAMEHALDLARAFTTLICKAILANADKGLGSDALAGRALLQASNKLLQIVRTHCPSWLKMKENVKVEHSGSTFFTLHVACSARDLVLRCRMVCLEEMEKLAFDVSPKVFVQLKESLKGHRDDFKKALGITCLSGALESMDHMIRQQNRVTYTIVDSMESTTGVETSTECMWEQLQEIVHSETKRLYRHGDVENCAADRATWLTLMEPAPFWLKHEASTSPFPEMVLEICMRLPKLSLPKLTETFVDCSTYVLCQSAPVTKLICTNPRLLEVPGVQDAWHSAFTKALRRSSAPLVSEYLLFIPDGYLKTEAVTDLAHDWNLCDIASNKRIQPDDSIALAWATARFFELASHNLQSGNAKEAKTSHDKMKKIVLDTLELVKIMLRKPPDEQEEHQVSVLEPFLQLIDSGAAAVGGFMVWLLLFDCRIKSVLEILSALDPWIELDPNSFGIGMKSNSTNLKDALAALLYSASLRDISSSLSRTIRSRHVQSRTSGMTHSQAFKRAHGADEQDESWRLPALQKWSIDGEEEDLFWKHRTPESDEGQEKELELAKTLVRIVVRCLDRPLHQWHKVELPTLVQELFMSYTSNLLSALGSLIGAYPILIRHSNIGGFLVLASQILLDPELSKDLSIKHMQLTVDFVTSVGCGWHFMSPQPLPSAFARLLTLFIQGLSKASSEERQRILENSFRQIMRKAISPQWMLVVSTTDALLRNGHLAPKSVIGCTRLLPAIFQAAHGGRIKRYLSSNVPKLLEASLSCGLCDKTGEQSHALLRAVRIGVSSSKISPGTLLLGKILALPSNLLCQHLNAFKGLWSCDMGALGKILYEASSLLRLVLKDHFSAIHRCIPVLVNSVRTIMLALAHLEAKSDKGLEDRVKHAAQSISHLLGEISQHRKELGRYYPHILADYIELAALASLDPLQVAAEEGWRTIEAGDSFRNLVSFGPIGLQALLPGVMSLLDACPAAERQMLHVGLAGGAHGARRATLQRMRQSYETSFRYTGKV